MAKKIVVLDYGSGNVRSVSRAFERLGATVGLTHDADQVLNADGLVVPGVGAFKSVMQQLEAVNAPFLVGRRVSGSRPVLGVCVGLQVMFDEGIEQGERSAGLGQLPGRVEALEAEIVPHVGWNTVRPAADSILFDSVAGERFYFVHSYAVNQWAFTPTATQLAPPQVAWSDYGAAPFVAAVENGALSATQFHPEKSGDAGLMLLKNWLGTL